MKLAVSGLSKTHFLGLRVRIVELYLCSRRVKWSLLTLVSLALATWTYTGALVFWAGVGPKDWALIPIMLFVAPAAGSIVGVSAFSPFADVERTVSCPLYTFRAGHLISLVFCAGLLFTGVLLSFDLGGAWPEHPLLAFQRNLIGYTGLGLIGARLLGARSSWILPFAAIASPVPWSIWSGTDTFSWIIALSLFFTGFGLACMYGARDQEPRSGWGDG